MSVKEKLFEMGAKFDTGWEADNRKKSGTEKRNGKSLPPEKHRLFINREKRRGKWVSIVGRFSLEKQEIQSLFKRLKKRLGTGGAAKEETLEFQGDIGERIREVLEREGFHFR